MPQNSMEELPIQIIIGIILWIFILPGIIVVILPLYILRYCHHYLARFLRPDLIPVENIFDNFQLLKPSSERQINNVCQIWKLSGSLDISSFRDYFYEVFLSTPELRLRYENLYCHFVTWGFYLFKRKSEVDLTKQIKEMEWEEGNENLDSFMGSWLSRADYGESPNWQILLIQRKNEGTILLWKMDHVLADGYTLIHLVEKLSGVKQPYIVKQDEIGLIRKMQYILLYPFTILQMCIRLRKLQPAMEPLNKISPAEANWMISFTTLDLHLVKTIRNLTNCHFNSVLGTLLTGAIRRHCIQTMKEEELPQELFIPWPNALPNHPSMTTEGAMTNHMKITGSFIPLRNPNCLNRLVETERNFQQMDSSGYELTNNWITLNLLWAFPPQMSKLYLDLFARFRCFPGYESMTSLLLSEERHSLMGIPVDNLHFAVFVPHIAKASHMVMMTGSNSGRMDVTISASDGIFKTQEDLDKFTSNFKYELNFMLKELQST